MTFNTPTPAGGPSISAFDCADADRGLRCLSFAALSQLLAPRFGFILCLIVVLAAQYATSPWRKVPPGPKGLPALGNVLQLKDKRWMFGKDCKRNFRMPNFISLSLVARQVYQDDRKSYVFECPGSAHDRH